MNRIYKKVWNDSLGAYVAVSELSTSKGKASGGCSTSKSRAARSRVAAALAALSFGFTATCAWSQSADVTKYVVVNPLPGAADASATGADAVAIGPDAVASESNTVAIGNKAVATGTNSAAIGLQTKASHAESVALGSYSETDRDFTVSVGNAGMERQIVHVKAGTADGDAVNVSQLKPAVEALGGGAKVDATTGAVTGPSYTLQGNTHTTVGDALHALDDGIVKNADNLTDATRYIKVNGVPGVADAKATGGNAIAIGANTVATDDNGIAIGSKAETLGVNSAAIGIDTKADHNESVALGSYSETDRDFAVSVGNAGLERQIVHVKAGTADGDAVNVSQLKPTVDALGGGAKVDAATGAVTGPSYTVQGGAHTTVGDALHALDDGVAGATRYVKVNGLSGVADAKATGGNAVAIGANTVATDDNTIAIGNTAKTTGVNSIAIGLETKADHAESVALGSYSETDRDFAVSVGNAGLERQIVHVKAGTADSDAVNVGQLKPTVDALGGGANIDAATGAVTGPSYTVQGNAHTNVGDALHALDDGISQASEATRYVKVNGLTGVADASATGGNSVAIGSNTVASHSNAIAVGNTAAATGVNSVAAGLESKAEHAESVALGSYSETDRDFAVSVGNARMERQIVYVKAGTADTDAVNVGQLKPAVDALGGGAHIDAATGAVTGPNYAVQNGTQTTVGGALDALDAGVKKNTGDISDITNIINNGSLGLVQQDAATQALTVAKDRGGDSVSFLGTAGSRQLTGVSAGKLSADSTDAVNGSQLFATNEKIDAINTNVGDISQMVKYDDASHETLTLGNAGKPVKLGNVADGVNANDAVNVGQLSSANSTISQAITNNMKTAFGNTLGYFKADGASDGSEDVVVADGTKGTAMGAAAKVKAGADNAVALGAGSVADQANTVSVGAAGKERRITNVADGVDDTDAANVSQLKKAGIVDRDGSTKDVLTYDAGSQRGVVTLGGGTAGTLITNVRDGLIASGSRDAVNGGQIASLRDDLQNKITNVDNRVTVIENKPSGSGGKSTAGLAVDGADGASGKPAVVTTGKSGTATGSNAQALGVNSTAEGANAIASASNSTAIGSGTQAKADNSVALGANAVADRANTVSVGSATEQRQITQVAAGTAATDAVNVGQMQGQMASTLNQANGYTDQRFNQLWNRQDQFHREANRGIASSAALVNNMPYVPGKVALSAGAATYRGEGALGVGVSRWSNNGRVNLNAGVSMAHGDRPIFRMGVGVILGD
jgi:autotransporter adhesin